MYILKSLIVRMFDIYMYNYCCTYFVKNAEERSVDRILLLIVNEIVRGEASGRAETLPIEPHMLLS